MHKYSFTYRTIFSDLDTQHHMNSNRYFDLFESGKYLLLANLGLTKEIIEKENVRITQNNTQFKFLNQIRDNAQIEIDIHLDVFKNGYLKWYATIRNDSKLCFEINSVNSFEPTGLFDELITKQNAYEETTGLLDIRSPDRNKFAKEYELRFTDRNYFGYIPENISWKLFEDTRWNQLKHLGITLSDFNRMDIAFFWRDSDYRYSNVFRESEKVISKIWIEKIDKIRVVFAHEIYNEYNEMICNSINTFIPVSITKMKPRGTPHELIGKIKKYVKESVL